MVDASFDVRLMFIFLREMNDGGDDDDDDGFFEK